MESSIVFTAKEEILKLIETALKKAVSSPISTVDREKFLRKELSLYCTAETVEKALATTPAEAGVPYEYIRSICQSVIKLETNTISIASFVSNLPGGVLGGVLATADLMNYFCSLSRLAIKLGYLHGVDFDVDDGGSLSDESINKIIPMIGAMIGVAEANKAVVYILSHYSRRLSKTVSRKALTKTMVYPVVKKISKKIGVRMTKQIYADIIAGIVPVVGAVVCGGMTFFSFKSCGNRLISILEPYYDGLSEEKSI